MRVELALSLAGHDKGHYYVILREEGDFVYVVQNGVVKKKAVELGITSNSKVEIKSGLKEGDKVVADTLGTVEEGMKVTTTTVAKSEEK